jgi:hypothetical protein
VEVDVNPCRLVVVVGVLAVAGDVRAQDASSASSTPGTGAILAAPRVDTSVRVALSADGKSLRYGLDREIRNPPGHPLPAGQVFVASHDVKVTYYKLNPLALDVSADVSDAPDPSQGIIANRSRRSRAFQASSRRRRRRAAGS